ncbi:hypothetical protein [Mobilicoccus massiliensis]|uniref:hypothetical protein n=1 Tax=Mobilicoccus massiliensis TaxID=1522310 RepID=UPI001143295D|nr:hypothetical protein [Mobilicoccus massiliensis]
MKKRMVAAAMVALVGLGGLSVATAESASAADGWKLHSTRTVDGKTYYRYTNDSGGVMLTNHTVDANGSSWVAE